MTYETAHNADAIKAQVQVVIDEYRASIRYARQHAVSKKRMAEVEALGLAWALPSDCGNGDAQAVINAATPQTVQAWTGSDYDVQTFASKLYQLMNTPAPEPTPEPEIVIQHSRRDQFHTITVDESEVTLNIIDDRYDDAVNIYIDWVEGYPVAAFDETQAEVVSFDVPEVDAEEWNKDDAHEIAVRIPLSELRSAIQSWIAQYLAVYEAIDERQMEEDDARLEQALAEEDERQAFREQAHAERLARIAAMSLEERAAHDAETGANDAMLALPSYAKYDFPSDPVASRPRPTLLDDES